MKKVVLTLFIGSLISISCTKQPTGNVETWKEEIVNTEKDFSNLSADKGIAKAFITYAADDAVLNRNDSLIIGIERIKERFKAIPANPGILTWEPEFVEVSKSGDLGYTYGHYNYAYQDSTGNDLVRKGVFHTVWKRQEDGGWKYVWD